MNNSQQKTQKKAVVLSFVFCLSVILIGSLGYVRNASAVESTIDFSEDSNVLLTGNNVTLVVESGSKAESYEVGATTITIELGTNGDTFTLTDTDSTRRVMFLVNSSLQGNCSNDASWVTLSNVATTTYVIEPRTDSTCSTSGSGAAGGGGGGGGGGVVTPTPSVTAPSTTTGTVTATQAAGGVTTYTPSDTSTPSLKVTVPSNAVTANTTVSVTSTTLSNEGISLAVTSAGATQMIGQPLRLTATSGSTTISTFSQPLTLTFTYTLAQLPAGVSESELTVFYYDAVAGTWTELAGTLDTVNHTVSVQLTHFSVFVLVAKPSPKTTPVVTPPVTVTGAHANGTLILDKGTIYLIVNGKKRGFRNPEEYFSHGYKFSQAVPANDADRQLSSDVQPIQKALDGTLGLVKKGTIFMIANGQKRGFTSAAVFKALGYKFNQAALMDLSDYPEGVPITSASNAHPEGALVVDKKGTVWWILNETRQGFQSAEVFFTYGFTFSRVVAANAADLALPEGPLVKFRDGTIVKDGEVYFLISDGMKRQFVSVAALERLGYSVKDAIKAALTGYTGSQTIE